MTTTSGLEFDDVDGSRDPGALMAYLDVTTAQQSVQQYKRQSFALLDLRPGFAVLDVGCGTGDDVRVLATQVGQEGRAVGLDSSEAAIAEARARSEDDGLPVEFRVGGAHQLPFDADTFDAARSERVLQHLQDPAQALAELVRVTRPGRPVVVMDPDWDTLVVDSPDRRVTREIVCAYSDAVPNGWIGRRLRGLFLEAGLRGVQVVPVAIVLTNFALASQIFWLATATERAAAIGAITEDQAAGWLAQLEESDRQGRFFSGLTGYIVAGRKPEPT